MLARLISHLRALRHARIVRAHQQALARISPHEPHPIRWKDQQP